MFQYICCHRLTNLFDIKYCYFVYMFFFELSYFEIENLVLQAMMLQLITAVGALLGTSVSLLAEGMGEKSIFTRD